VKSGASKGFPERKGIEVSADLPGNRSSTSAVHLTSYECRNRTYAILRLIQRK